MAPRLPVELSARRVGWPIALAIALAGCSSTGSVSSADTNILKAAGLLFDSVTGNGSGDAVSRERVAAIPYATLGARLGSSDQALLVLASQSGDNLVWLAGKRIAITTRHGRVVQTAGFAHNLSGTTALPGKNGSPVENYLYDFAEQSRYGIAVQCVQSDLGREPIAILGVAHDTHHVGEDCAAPQLDWQFRNEFWRDASGFVWKSRQFVSPDLDALTLEVMRPAE